MDNASIVQFFEQTPGGDVASLIYEFAEDTVYLHKNLRKLTISSLHVNYKTHKTNEQTQHKQIYLPCSPFVFLGGPTVAPQVPFV